MDARTRRTMEEMISHVSGWVKLLAEDSSKVDSPEAAKALEQRVRQEGQSLLGALLEGLLQNALDHQPPAKTCPHCGRPRRHKGVRTRGLLSSVGAIRLSGIYWHCTDCGGQHACEGLVDASASGPMRELLCLLGTATGSFAKAATASKKLLGVPVSEASIRRLCYQEGRRVAVNPPAVQPGDLVVGSCDGTMIHTTQHGWKELKAYQFCYGSQRHGRAYWESSDQFTPRLRHAAVAMGAGEAEQLFWVSDAADWIDKGVAVHLPMAIRIVDIWHARQHIYEAAGRIYPDDEKRARSWARRYGAILEDDGGLALWQRLGHATYAEPARQEAVETLRRYLRRQADRLDYPRYKANGWPISSGPMESFCKQLGQRLKGPGMRWSLSNINPMAALVSLWATGEWDNHWKSVA